MNPVRWWKLRRMRAELSQLRLRDRYNRTIPGHTMQFTAEEILRLGTRIAILIHEINKLDPPKDEEI
jgi:hypothetical protein